MEILKLKTLEHSGQGKNATHKKVLAEFRKSEEQGIYYCRQRGWDVKISETLLEVASKDMFGFRMSVLIKR